VEYDRDDRMFVREGRIQFLELEKDGRTRAAFGRGKYRRGIYRYCDDLEFP